MNHESNYKTLKYKTSEKKARVKFCNFKSDSLDKTQSTSL